MPADLKVVSVLLPSPLRAPCPVVVQVTIRNDGPDSADPVPYDVTIDLGPNDAQTTRFKTTVTTPEGQHLAPGQTIIVSVVVRFPCAATVLLRATVDPTVQIPNNVPSAPSQTLSVSPTGTPWLTTALRIGIRDAAGVVLFDPDGLCPGKPLVAEITITNRGCVVSKQSTTEVRLQDAGAGSPVPTTFATKAYLTPALAPGASQTTSIDFQTPPSATATSGTLGVRVTADA